MSAASYDFRGTDLSIVGSVKAYLFNEPNLPVDALEEKAQGSHPAQRDTHSISRALMRDLLIRPSNLKKLVGREAVFWAF